MKPKTYLFVIIAFCLSAQIAAQTPQAIPYQAVARDNSGNLIANQNISIRFTIHDVSANGTILYMESHHPTTNELGLFSVNVGQGSLVTGTFSALKWETNSKFLQVELDPANGTNYTDMGTQQMLSVPYALLSGKSNSILDSLVLRDSTGDVRMVLNPNTGTFKMMHNDTIWYLMNVNSPTYEKHEFPGGSQVERYTANNGDQIERWSTNGQPTQQTTHSSDGAGSYTTTTTSFKNGDVSSIHSVTSGNVNKENEITYDENGLINLQITTENGRITRTSSTNGVIRKKEMWGGVDPEITIYYDEFGVPYRDLLHDQDGDLSYWPGTTSLNWQKSTTVGDKIWAPVSGDTTKLSGGKIEITDTTGRITTMEPGISTVESTTSTNETNENGSEQKNGIITITNGIDITDPNGLTGGFSCTEDATGNQSSVQIKPSQIFMWTPSINSASAVICFQGSATQTSLISGTNSLVITPSLSTITGPFSLNTGPNSFNVTPTGASWAGTLSLSGPISSTNLTVGSSGLIVTGPTSLSGLNVSGSSVFNGLTVNGSSNFSGLTVTGPTDLSGCTITGGLTVSGGAAISGPSVGLTSGPNSFVVTPTFGNFTGTLSVTGPTTITNGQNTFSVYQRVQLQSGSNELKVDPIDGLTVTGPTSLGGALTVTNPSGITITTGGLSTPSANIGLSGCTVTGGLTATGGATISGPSVGLTSGPNSFVVTPTFGNFTGTLSCTGPTTITEGQNTISVFQRVKLQSGSNEIKVDPIDGITVTGPTSMGGSVTVSSPSGINITNGGLSASGNVSGGSLTGGSINISGAANVGGTVTVTGGGGVNITTGGLTAVGPITGGSVSAGSFDVSGPTNAGGIVTVTAAGGINIPNGGLTASGIVSAGSLSGAGGSITLINGSNISTGTINDGRLSANIPKLNQPAVFAGPLAVNLTTPGQDAIIGAAFGQTPGAPSNLAGKFYGNVNITGNLTKGGGTFKIDHPLDPKNKFLYHSFVESPDMMNIYTGTVAFDDNGKAVVELPDWFESLNKDFHYQLTCVGGFAQVYINKEISNNSFEIAGGKKGMKVSWQVTGVRHDAYADKHRVIVEEEKPIEERGKYLHPEAFQEND